jgi:glutamyl-tRNA synthetase
MPCSPNSARPAKISHATPKFDLEDLTTLNAKILHMTPFSAVKERLAALGLAAADENFWNAVRSNLDKLSDAKQWWTVAHGPLQPTISEPEFVATAATLLPAAPWTNDTWSQWTNFIKEKTGRKGKDLFMPLRLALTSAEHGPEMKILLPIIGPERAHNLLAGKTA